MRYSKCLVTLTTRLHTAMLNLKAEIQPKYMSAQGIPALGAEFKMSTGSRVGFRNSFADAFDACPSLGVEVG